MRKEDGDVLYITKGKDVRDAIENLKRGVYDHAIIDNGLSQEQIDFVKNLSHEMKTQDNRSTANPYALVIGQKERQVTDYENASEKAVHWSECNYNSYEEFIEALEEYYWEDNESHPVLDYIKENDIEDIDDLRISEYDINKLIDDPISVYGYVTVDDFSSNAYGGNFFLTDKSAKQYVQSNRHNLREPFTYGIHLYRNREMEKLYEVIHKIAEVFDEQS